MSTPLSEVRAKKDQFFRAHPRSPLTEEQKAEFQGLNYFPENEALRLNLELELIEGLEPIQVQTSTGETRTYGRYGKIHFTVDGEPVTLTVYATDHGLFLPFVDSLANSETYGAGRYLDPQEMSGGRILVDFNLAYNPYCAYNEKWSCPLTPFENRLKVAIRAGEKNFKA